MQLLFIELKYMQKNIACIQKEIIKEFEKILTKIFLLFSKKMTNKNSDSRARSRNIDF